MLIYHGDTEARRFIFDASVLIALPRLRWGLSVLCG